MPVQPLDSGAVSKVLASDSAKFQAGDIVTGGLTNWATHQLVKSGQNGVDALVKIDPKAGVPLSYYTGILGGFCCSLTDAIHADAVVILKTARTAWQRGPRGDLPHFIVNGYLMHKHAGPGSLSLLAAIELGT